MKNELLKKIISSKEEEIREKEKELKNIKYNLMCVKKDGLLMGYTIEEIKASIAFTEEYIKFIQEEIIVLKNMCDRYKKKYNLEDNKMKLSELKEKIIELEGEKRWEKIKNTEEFKLYIASEKEQKKVLQKRGADIQYINNPTEEMQLEAVKENGLAIRYINNPTEKVIEEAIKDIDLAYDIFYILKHIENDLDED